MIDPLEGRLTWHVDLDAAPPDSDAGELLPCTAEGEHNVVSSLCEDGWHRPALDIDVPIVVVPSSTPGHHHLYFPTVTLDTQAYGRLLDALVDAGIVQALWAMRLDTDGQTLLRPPHIKKGN